MINNATNIRFIRKVPNARLSGEQRYHFTQLLHRKHKSQIKPNRRALRIRLKTFVIAQLTSSYELPLIY